MTSNTYQIKDYAITTSLFEMSIYIRVVNNLSFQCFEDNVDITQINLPFNNKKIYDILSKCFNNDNENYSVKFLMKKSILNLDFRILFDGSFDINFSFILNEIIMKADSKMTLNFHKIEADNNKMILNFHKMEADNNKKNEFLENRIQKLEEMVECLVNVNISYFNPSYGQLEFKPLNSLELDVYNNVNQQGIYDNYCKIECFYQLNKLTLGGSYQHRNINFKNKTLQILIIANGSNYLSSLENLDKLPSLEIIEVRCSSLSNADNIIPYLHKNIKKISFFNGQGNGTKDNLIPYCTKNKIDLIYT